MADTSMIDAVSFFRQYVQLANNGKPTRSWQSGELQYNSSCPWCPGSEDRFMFTSTGRWTCKIRSSGCGRHGSDVISFLMQYKGIKYPAACEELGVDPGSQYNRDAIEKLKAWLRPDLQPPSPAWQERAEDLVYMAQRKLFSTSGKEALSYLMERGLTKQTIIDSKLGYIPVGPDGKWLRDSLGVWGIEKNKDDPKPWVTLIPGILIPYYIDGQIWRLNVRKLGNSTPKYVQIRDSKEALYNADAIALNKPVVLVESELDAASGNQVASDLAAFVATGGTTNARHDLWLVRLGYASCVLLAMDDDEPDEDGKRPGDEGKQFWLEALPHAMHWLPWKHDINDMLTGSQDIRKWVQAGLEAYKLLQSAPGPLDKYASHCCVCDAPIEDPDPHKQFFYAPDGALYCDRHWQCPRPDTQTQSQLVVSWGDIEEMPEPSPAREAITKERFMEIVEAATYRLPGTWTITEDPEGYTIEDRVRKLKQERLDEIPVATTEEYWERIRMKLGDYKAEVPAQFLERAKEPRSYPAPFPCYELQPDAAGVYHLVTVGMWNPTPDTTLAMAV